MGLAKALGHQTPEARSEYLLDEKLLGVCFLQLQAQARTRPVGEHVVLARFAESIEKHSFNAGVIMEELQMTCMGNGTTGVHVYAWGTMRGECDLMCVADRGRG